MLTFRHDVVHSYRQKEDGVAVVSPRAGAEVLLHGLHNRKQLLCEDGHVMEQYLHDRLTQLNHVNSKSQDSMQSTRGCRELLSSRNMSTIPDRDTDRRQNCGVLFKNVF